MAALTLTNGLLYMRSLLQDSNTSFPAATDTEYTRLINDTYLTWYRNIEIRAGSPSNLVTNLTAGSTLVASETTFTHSEILGAFRDAAGVTVTLERMSLLEVQVLQELEPTTGPPTRYGAYKRHGNSERWALAFHPIPDTTYTIKAYARIYPTALSAGADVPELGDAEGYWMYRIAASQVAQIIGRPEMIEQILAPIPDSIRGLMGVERKRLDPKRRPESRDMVIS